MASPIIIVIPHSYDIFVNAVIPRVDDFHDSIFNPLFIVVNSFTLLLMSLSLLMYGAHMKSNLIESTDLLMRDSLASRNTGPPVKSASNIAEEDIGLKIKLKILARINRTLAILLICYTFRVIALIYVVVTVESGVDYDVSLTLWLFFSWMIPSVPVSRFQFEILHNMYIVQIYE